MDINTAPDLLHRFMELLTNPLGLFVTFVFAVFVFFRHIQSDQFFSWFERKDKNRIAALEAYLSEDSHHSENQQLIKEMREAHYFKKATGMDVDVEWIAPLIAFHQSLNGKIRWQQIQFAHKFLELDNNQITLSQSIHSLWRKFDLGFQILLAFGAIFLSLLMLILGGLAYFSADGLNFQLLFMSLGGSIIGTGLGVLIARDAKDIVSAKRIDQALKEAKIDSKKLSKPQ